MAILSFLCSCAPISGFHRTDTAGEDSARFAAGILLPNRSEELPTVEPSFDLAYGLTDRFDLGGRIEMSSWLLTTQYPLTPRRRGDGPSAAFVGVLGTGVKLDYAMRVGVVGGMRLGAVEAYRGLSMGLTLSGPQIR